MITAANKWLKSYKSYYNSKVLFSSKLHVTMVNYSWETPGNIVITITSTANTNNNNQDFAYNKYLLCTACYAMKNSIIITTSWRMDHYYYYYSPSGRSNDPGIKSLNCCQGL